MGDVHTTHNWKQNKTQHWNESNAPNASKQLHQKGNQCCSPMQGFKNQTWDLTWSISSLSRLGQLAWDLTE